MARLLKLDKFIYDNFTKAVLENIKNPKGNEGEFAKLALPLVRPPLFIDVNDLLKIRSLLTHIEQLEMFNEE